MNYSKVTGNIITGKTIQDIDDSQISSESGEQSAANIPKLICSGSECNPTNTQQICQSGQWANCPNEQVCTLGACATPINVKLDSPEVFSISGGSDSGGGSSSAGTSTPSQSIRALGEIGTEDSYSLISGEKISVIRNGATGIFTLTLGTTSATLQFEQGTTLIINLGEEKSADISNDGIADISFLLKSINIVKKEGRFIIKPI